MKNLKLLTILTLALCVIIALTGCKKEEPAPAVLPEAISSAEPGEAADTAMAKIDKMDVEQLRSEALRIKEMIVEKQDASTIRESCIQTGMKTMLDDGIEKVARGITSLDEVLRVIRE